MKHEHNHEGDVNHKIELPDEVVEEIEEIKGRMARLKQHIQKHQTIYACGVTGIVCILGTRTFGRSTVNNIIEPVFNNAIAPVFNNDNSSTVNFGGPATKVVKCLETGEIWEKVTEAAGSAGVTVQKMSKHLNGHKEHVNDLHYKIIGLGTTD